MKRGVFIVGAEDITVKHKELLYPIVRVRTQKSAGSGTVIYSKAKVNNSEYETYILTNYHVIDDAIQIDWEWSAFLNKDIRKERRAIVTVDFFKYKYLSRNIGTFSIEADIVAYSRADDLALLKLRSIEKIDNVAKLYKRSINDIHIFDKVYAVGCSLAHPPVQTYGEIMSMDDEIESKEFWLSNAQIIFGNSGGAIFLADSHEFIGIPSRVAVVGWNTPVSHMGYFIPIHRIYKFLNEECYQFIYDDKYTPEQCEKLREEKRERLLKLYRETPQRSHEGDLNKEYYRYNQ